MRLLNGKLLADTFRCKSTLVDQLSKKRHQLTEINKSCYSAEFSVNLNMYWRGTTLSLGRIDLYFSRITGFNYTVIGLLDFLDREFLEGNRRNKFLHSRVYQKDQSISFVLECKHGQTQLV